MFEGFYILSLEDMVDFLYAGKSAQENTTYENIRIIVITFLFVRHDGKNRDGSGNQLKKE